MAEKIIVCPYCEEEVCLTTTLHTKTTICPHEGCGKRIRIETNPKPKYINNQKFSKKQKSRR